ncbi:adhesion G protein-coupled receptor E4-like [Leptidea sinapis]|uniref:adhesion G protein-coupled receptor E4-like n=1 Tax=Leptidea sinapis TaxID=189913 RepID=UPI0021C2C8FD|nr:adhesion G protein-coupled receptor E4-like [Leptidea sinapis]
MNRIMILDKKYLQLSQTLNSTNVILDTIGKIIEILTKKTNCITPQTARITHEVMAREPEFIIQDSNIPKNTKTLNIISLIGSFLSLSGIMGIWITATVFQAWRKKPGTKILINLTVYNLGTICEGDENGIIRKKMRVVCIILGALLHYSVLASFMWMLIAASLQFIRYVRVFGVYRPSRFMVKFTLIGWGIPVLPLRLSIFLFFLLGLTWVFGLFSFSKNLIWSYLFCLTSTLQGFVLFVYFVICDPITRNLWVALLNSSSKCEIKETQ